MRHIFHYFPYDFSQKRGLNTSCSPGDPPSDLQNVKNSPEPPSPHTTPKMTSKPTKLIRNENIQFTATPCSRSELQEFTRPFLIVFLDGLTHAWNDNFSRHNEALCLRELRRILFCCVHGIVLHSCSQESVFTHRFRELRSFRFFLKIFRSKVEEVQTLRCASQAALERSMESR